MSVRARLLVVEDDESLREGLRVVLEKAGYEVRTAIRGQDALQQIREDPPDLVVLDLMLPGLDGSFVLERARRDGFTAPVIILSARASVEDRIWGLRKGADDYVTKPFDLGELLARINARLRRAHGEHELGFGDIVVDLAARRVVRRGEAVHLTPKEFDLLALLVMHPDRALNRGRILDEVWGNDYQGTRRTVDNFVRSLRIKLEDDPENPRFLLTVRARGYRFDPRGRG
ncbi:MAG: response regulator transcription factor [Acidobacteriota bacterium]|nr:MAG: response regulator transcription factor [Acidobacteriota bacterium]